MILYCIIFTVILSTVYDNRANYNTYKLYYDLTFAFIKHLKLILDTYFEIQFIRVLYFFIRIKNIKRKEKYMSNFVFKYFSHIVNQLKFKKA